MTEYTDNFGFSKFGPGSSLSDDGYKILAADRELLDLLLQLAMQHSHTGGTGTGTPPALSASLTLDSSTGSLLAGRRIYYQYTFIDTNGIETIGSPVSFVDTPSQVGSPAAPTLTPSFTGGTLLPGNYYYILSAYTGPNNFESPATYPAFTTIGGSALTNKITLTLPTLPGGADGFNVYRRKPGGTSYYYIASIDMETPVPTWVDDGSYEEDCDRTPPATNTTQSTNSVVVTVPSLPAGYQWRLYRSYDQNVWSQTVLTTVPSPTLEYTDTGGATSLGAPPSTTPSVFVPGKVELTDLAEVEGRLPFSGVSGFPQEIPFVFEGALVPISGTHTWVCEYPKFRIFGVRAILGRGYAPVEDDVIVDVNRAPSSDTPVFTTIYTTQANRPRIVVANQRGARTVPDVIEFVEGDMMTVDIDQSGGGVTPNDRDLTVIVYGAAYGWPTNDSMDW